MEKPIIFLAFANDRIDYGRYLRNLPLELKGIRSALGKSIEKGWCELIVRTNVTIDEIIDVFQQHQNRVAIFHYGGHADGYQLLLEEANGSVAVAHGAGLVRFFGLQQNLHLIFLNGCSTKKQGTDLIAAAIPAVIGTESSIDDEAATEIAVHFYKGIGLNFSIEKAWEEAQAVVKIKKDDANRGLRLRRNDNDNTLPWILHTKDDAAKLWQLDGTKEYNKKAIFKLLFAMFNDDDFMMFCLFNFENVHNNFTVGQNKKQKILLLMDYANRFMENDKLLLLLEEENPTQFERFKPYYK